MSQIQITRFATTEDFELIAKQLAESVNKIELLLQELPFYFGSESPENSVVARAGSLYVQTGTRGQNYAQAKPYLYIKTQDSGSSGWQVLLLLGSQAQTEVSARRGALYLQVPDELTSNAVLYFKQSNDESTTGWTTL